MLSHQERNFVRFKYSRSEVTVMASRREIVTSASCVPQEIEIFFFGGKKDLVRAGIDIQQATVAMY